MRFGIIADDLTGSCDVAACLNSLGYRPLVLLGQREGRGLAFPRPPRKTSPLILNMRSRDCTPRETAARARAAALFLRRSKARVLYQKIDSTLRGHWADALKTLARVTRTNRVWICPAFPGQGRFVRNGRVRGARTAEGHSVHTPGIPSDIESVLHKRCGCEARVVGLEIIRRGARAIESTLAMDKGVRWLIFDAERESDLATIGRAFRESAGYSLAAGSAGLARYVLPANSSRKRSSAPRPARVWLFIGGSRHPASVRQYRGLHDDPKIYVARFSPKASTAEKGIWRQQIVAALAQGRHAALTVPKRFDARVPKKFRAFLEDLLTTLRLKPQFEGIVVTGGSTAEDVCDSLGIRTLEVVEELRSGIARSVALDGVWPGLALVTKAGGFGGPEDVREILRRSSGTLPKPKT